MSDADAPRHTIDSPIRIGKVHPKARKQFHNLSRAHQQLLMQKVSRELAPTEYKMYRGSHIRKHRLYHTHVTDNIVFNFLIEDGEGIVVFIGKHKDTDHAADQFHKQSLDLSSALSLEESGLLLPATAEPEEEPMADSPAPSFSDEGQTHPDLVDVAGLLDSSIRSLVGELLDDSLLRKIDAIELRVDQQELDHEALGITLIQEQSSREEAAQSLQSLLKEWASLQRQIQVYRQTDADTQADLQAKLQRRYDVTAQGLARGAATVRRLSRALQRLAQQFRHGQSAMEELAESSQRSDASARELALQLRDMEVELRDLTATQQRLQSEMEQRHHDSLKQAETLQQALAHAQDQLETQTQQAAEMKKAQVEAQNQLRALQEELTAIRDRPSWWRRIFTSRTR